MDNRKKIVVLGAGYGGVLTAKKLIRKIKKNHLDVEITIIDKHSYHTMLTELHEVAAGRVPEEAIRINLEKIFAGREINVVLDDIKNIDFEAQQLTSDQAVYDYDYLVVGTGSKPTFFGVKGANEYTHKLWSFDDAVKLKEHILAQFRKASIEKNLVEREKQLTFVVAGAGFTGVEMIGELGEWKERLCSDFHIEERDVNLYVVDILPSVLPNFPEKLIKKTEHRLTKLGVKILAKTNITEVGPDFISFGDKGGLDTNTVIWAAGVEGNTLVESVAIKKEGRNRISTNGYLQSLEYKNVYAVGDNIFTIPEGEERPVPQMVENAEHSASTVAKNIIAELKGQPLETYKPAFHGAMVCIGGRYGVAHVGLPGKFMAFSGLIAMFIKHFINVVYFFQVAGFNKIWTYAIHEIFGVRDRRSFLGGHFSKASPNFWLLPIRLFLGYMWLNSGLEKFPKIWAEPNNIFLIPPSPLAAVSAATATAEGATDAVSAATTATVQAVPALPVPEFIQGIVDWSMALLFYTPEGAYTFLATLFQTAMVLAEIGVGLALIAGLFTALTSLVSIAMGLMIWISGMAPFEMLWYLASSVACIGGSGSVFGLDYYVLPWLKKKWKKIHFVKKYYLYTD